MKKILLITLIFICALGNVNAQQIKFKKGKVLIDKNECLTYSSESFGVELSTVDGTQTILLKNLRTGSDDLYVKIVFVEQKKSLTSITDAITRKSLVKKLLSSKVLTNCTIDENQIDKFIMKYDEKVEDSLIRY